MSTLNSAPLHAALANNPATPTSETALELPLLPILEEFSVSQEPNSAVS